MYQIEEEKTDEYLDITIKILSLAKRNMTSKNNKTKFYYEVEDLMYKSFHLLSNIESE